jgi:predicted GTPase
MTTSKFTRWYDRDPRLKSVVNFLEKAPEEVRTDVAMDIIQLIIQENFTNSEELISFAKANYIGSGQRWYDTDELVHTAIEMLKLLNDRERSVLVHEIADSIKYFSISNYGKENETDKSGNRYLPNQ